ncbi:Alpha-acetolactate decarboxylase [Aquisphaera giovannonii]|uniref:Alpha-acetolactate decarboxylase n=1 Tax=Aquisphaera giovannonii TaxID=406548 RepID=A0A5B9WFS4_9BACT|nr:acetolactate decarboxylase [Aquisphaera giovannonii]QEH39129.1 Alpha-acetolactate decarboxylase [Aquisphaera giovannonii]
MSEPSPADGPLVPISCRVERAVWEAIEARLEGSNGSLDDLVNSALADYLQVGRSTLYQLSTAGALVEGIYRGEMTVARLRGHGDLGLGTFEGLDGEMVVVDGHFYQVRSDGMVSEVADGVSSPYAVLTKFDPGVPTPLSNCSSLADLEGELDRLRTSDNLFYAIRVDGVFSSVRTRAVPRTADGVPLVQAAASQPEFHLADVRGTIVGFWSPAYFKTLTVPGYHLHFLNEDRNAGGHLLDCAGRELVARIERESNLRLTLPHTGAFLDADFARDSSDDLRRAETAPGGHADA